ncbi:hypothetical protein [Phenylobacterium sp. SCN 70-31]|uniref:hypothetical protein n=1 Tax=Phenylobacterium sp. SCN 70-31 TaxID=1660129 RepID=UPI00086EDAF2|nr:hypothetical protein [Phenylobacterium sp. SCN 70-31]ODT86697.1 MAG: hypothetical protein ABS78_15555 [Phenylobacterium sp. SCN 70-31]
MKFETLGNMLGPSETLKVKCRACGRVTAFPVKLAIRAFGPDATPYDVRRKARCTACRARHPDVWM